MLSDAVFKRKFAVTMYKNLRISLGEMSFAKDFVQDTKGDPYPVLEKSADCSEKILRGRYYLESGMVKRFVAQYFPFGVYEMTANAEGEAGFTFAIPSAEARITVKNGELLFAAGESAERIPLPQWLQEVWTMSVSCRPGFFDVYFEDGGKPQYYHTFASQAFENANDHALFSSGHAAVLLSGKAVVSAVSCYIDNGISQADMRPIRYENGDIMTEQGKVYLTMSIRLQEKMMQGVFSWVPGTAQFALSGVLYYDTGDGKWCGDVASSILYHREKKQWYLWVCSFNHGHILGHCAFEGDPRFGVNVIDITLMEKAPEGTPITEFLGFEGDEDPDFFYDEATGKWTMAICRNDPTIRGYRYQFFESDRPFEGYTHIGSGVAGSETGGSFVRVKGERYFLCGNDFNRTSNYRIYSRDGMKEAKFDYPDGGFRGWGTLMPIKLGSRTRYFWLTFDRSRGSDYTWSYGNVYCFEADL